ncbi:MAG: hypothetical protein K2V38_18860 [Gemmataceae bacterium]|nr:hypothetical protein [Gemmataceae bacterium]
MLTPVCVCPECLEGLRPPGRARVAVRVVALVVAFVLLAVLATSCLRMLGGGLAIALVVVVYGWRRQTRVRRWQRRLKELLAGVPIYRQLLDEYPFATVHLPPRFSR